MRHLLCLLLALASVPLVRGAELNFLHTHGQDIVNESGDKVLLRGVGLGNWMLPEGYMWKFGGKTDRPRRIEQLVNELLGPEEAVHFWSQYRAQYISEADIARIAELGFNSVRPALNARLFLSETTPPQYQPEGFALLDDLVSWCKRHQLYVIIDMHAAPGGQTGQNIDDSRDDQPLLFMEPKYQEQLVSLWKKLAERYRNEPAVAGYDLLNEPLPERTGAAPKYKQQLEPLYRRLAAAIREVDPRHMLIVEGADWANDWSVFSKPFDANQVYQFHYYCWDQPAERKSIQQYLECRTRFNAPVWVGETGERDDRIYWATTEYFEANDIGWSFWPWKKMDTRNSPYSIEPPQNWDLVQEYSRGGDKPSPAVAGPIFQELLRNIRLTNCVFYPDVVNAMLRRAPGRVEAENFGAAGAEQSYHVKHPRRKAAFYRTAEPVAIEALGRRSRSQEFAICLQPEEWTAYSVEVAQPGTYTVSVRAKAGSRTGTLRISSGDQALSLPVGCADYLVQPVGSLQLRSGLNRLVVGVSQAEVFVDWLELTLRN